MARNDNGGNIMAFLIGAAVGGAVALLSQKNVRDMLRDKYYEGLDSMQEKKGDIEDAINDKIDDLSEEAYEKAKELRDKRRKV